MSLESHQKSFKSSWTPRLRLTLFPFKVAEFLLHVAKESIHSLEGDRHGTEFCQHLVPLGDTEALLCGWYDL